MASDVQLQPIDDDALESLLFVAVNDADPEEVMPAVPGPPGWTQARQDAFRAFHREGRAGFGSPRQEVSFAVAVDGAFVGVARLARKGDGRLEAGAWLGRSARGRGVGTAVLELLLQEAARLEASELIAETTAENVAAIAVLTRRSARLSVEASGAILARFVTVGAVSKLRMPGDVPDPQAHHRSKNRR
jgi:RimJ/RimL family protein N-acetyltransferase